MEIRTNLHFVHSSAWLHHASLSVFRTAAKAARKKGRKGTSVSEERTESKIPFSTCRPLIICLITYSYQPSRPVHTSPSARHSFLLGHLRFDCMPNHSALQNRRPRCHRRAWRRIRSSQSCTPHHRTLFRKCTLLENFHFPCRSGLQR